MALKQQQQLGQRVPADSEDSVLSDFFAFLRAGGVSVKKESQVVIVMNSMDLLPLLQHKASSDDLALIAGMGLLNTCNEGNEDEVPVSIPIAV
jgi:hypothetical protein